MKQIRKNFDMNRIQTHPEEDSVSICVFYCPSSRETFVPDVNLLSDSDAEEEEGGVMTGSPDEDTG